MPKVCGEYDDSALAEKYDRLIAIKKTMSAKLLKARETRKLSVIRSTRKSKSARRAICTRS
ncbi:MAG: hypothetical protein L6V93_16355 [Clostridiales bacterium]|nr:MAG: hypothetical protein L6V93_16355 [Clostridiales bacterium]